MIEFLTHFSLPHGRMQPHTISFLVRFPVHLFVIYLSFCLTCFDKECFLANNANAWFICLPRVDAYVLGDCGIIRSTIDHIHWSACLAAKYIRKKRVKNMCACTQWKPAHLYCIPYTLSSHVFLNLRGCLWHR